MSNAIHTPLVISVEVAVTLLPVNSCPNLVTGSCNCSGRGYVWHVDNRAKMVLILSWFFYSCVHHWFPCPRICDARTQLFCLAYLLYACRDDTRGYWHRIWVGCGRLNLEMASSGTQEDVEVRRGRRSEKGKEGKWRTSVRHTACLKLTDLKRSMKPLKEEKAGEE